MSSEGLPNVFRTSSGWGHVRRRSSTCCTAPSKGSAGGSRRAETIAYYRKREESHDGPKPGFGDLAREMGEAWADEGPGLEQNARAKLQELMQRKFGAKGVPAGEKGEPWLR